MATSVDLLFKGLPLIGQPIELVFGADDEAPVVDALVSVSGMLPALGGVVRVAMGVTASVAAALPALGGTVRVRYATDTARPTVGQTKTTWQHAQGIQISTTAHWQDGAPVSATVRAPWQDAQQLQVSVSARWQDADRTARQQTRTRWQDGQAVRSSIGVRFQDGIRSVRPSITTRWQDGTRTRAGTVTRYQDGNRDRRLQTRTRWQDAAPLSSATHDTAHNAVPLALRWGTRYQDAMRPPAGMWVPPGPALPDPCYVPPHGLHVELLFSDAWSASTELVFICERHGGGPGPDPEALIVIPVRRYYVVINDITLRRVDGNYELLAYGLSMSIDRDSWTWSFSATLRADALPYLEPGSRTEPVELEATINGAPYRLQVEKIGRDTQFGAVRIRISGRGRAAILAAPYAPVLNFGNSAPRTAQQLMADVLTINGVSIGWDVDWGLVDWPVPAGAWAMQGSYIDAITDIAAAAGGYVQPHATDATLRILPSYPKPPWEWDSITPDIELPAAAASVESIEWVDMPAYNRVFLGGVSKGVFGPFKRTGSDGSLLAPPVTHALITHADAHRQRGLSELSNTGRQAHYQLKTQVMPETGIIVPGNFVRYVGGAPVIGIVRGTRLDWSRPVMRQTIGVETHVAA